MRRSVLHAVLRRSAYLIMPVLALFAVFTQTSADVGDPVTRVECPPGYVATIHAEGLTSPDGLGFSPQGVLHVAEEKAGRVSRIGPDGNVFPVLTDLENPEGIAFDDAGSLYVVEDVAGGRVIRMAESGITTTLATGRDAPEGVVWASDRTVYITESNVQFADPLNYRTRVTAISPDGQVAPVRTDTLFWSYAGITIGPDGFLYVTNEVSHTDTGNSIYVVNPVTGDRTLFASGMTSPEGLRFSSGGGFPLYVAEEDIGDGNGRLRRVEADGTHVPFCTGFLKIEDVVLDAQGRLYVSEDDSGSIILVEPVISLAQVAIPPHGSSVAPGDSITYTLILTNNSASDITGVVLTDTLPGGVNFVPDSISATWGWSSATMPPTALVLTGTLPANRMVTATLSVTVSDVASGTELANRAEAMMAGSVVATGTTTHTVVVVPHWRTVFLPLLHRGVSSSVPVPGRR